MGSSDEDKGCLAQLTGKILGLVLAFLLLGIIGVSQFGLPFLRHWWQAFGNPREATFVLNYEKAIHEPEIKEQMHPGTEQSFRRVYIAQEEGHLVCIIEYIPTTYLKESPEGVVPMLWDLSVLAGAVEKSLEKEPELSLSLDTVRLVECDNDGKPLSKQEVAMTTIANWLERGDSFEDIILRDGFPGFTLTPGLYVERGNAYFEKGNYYRAIDEYTQAIKLKSNYADAYLHRGYAYQIRKDADHAINDFTQAIRCTEPLKLDTF